GLFHGAPLPDHAASCQAMSADDTVHISWQRVATIRPLRTVTDRLCHSLTSKHRIVASQHRVQLCGLRFAMSRVPCVSNRSRSTEMKGSRIRILVVEDEALSRHALCQVLHRSGFFSAGASDGAQALEMIKIFKPHAIIMDLRMPNIDG